jgi:hypothetical protein
MGSTKHTGERTILQRDSAAWRLGDLETWRLGGLEAWRLGA